MDKISFLNQCENELKEMFDNLDDIAFYNQKKVLNAFQKESIELRHFYGSTGYGNSDVGRDTLNKVFADVFGAEMAVVSPLITCGTHALFLALSSVLRPKDLVLSITGAPYDTLQEAIFGIEGKDNGSLKDFGIEFKIQNLFDNGHIDIDTTIKNIKNLSPRMIYIQRSRGYSIRSAISVEEIKDAIQAIRKINNDCLIFVDNCYGEFVEKVEPSDVGADLVVGSLCKNAGGGIVSTGGYIVGTKKAVKLVECRLTAPSICMEVGSYEAGYRLFYEGLFIAPSIVKNALKGAYLIGKVMEKLNFRVFPSSNEKSFDIVKSIFFNSEDELIKFVQLIQKCSPVDSDATPLPWEMPGYEDKVIMAAGTFVQGASIELSCDSPIRAPYVAYFQGGLTYEHAKIVAENLIDTYGNN
ncbi:MAG: methionine gamma-lyase family protein [Clostridia bacterium]|nr:methionine gamma-lyase family protein [Clostridia bacterium]